MMARVGPSFVAWMDTAWYEDLIEGSWLERIFQRRFVYGIQVSRIGAIVKFRFYEYFLYFTSGLVAISTRDDACSWQISDLARGVTAC